MAPLLQDGSAYLPYYPVVLFVCLIILVAFLLINCAGDQEQNDEPGSVTKAGDGTPARAQVVKRKREKPPSEDPDVPSRTGRPPLSAASRDDSNEASLTYMNQVVPVNEISSEYYVNTYMNAAAAGTILQPLEFDAKEIVDALKDSLSSTTIGEHRLELHDVIGKGTFGLVYRGTLKDEELRNPIDVAVKTVHGTSCTKKDMKSFLEEVLRMCGYRHVNVQRTIGICFRSDQPYAVMPFMDNGDLRAFVSSQERAITLRTLLDFGLQIAKGMEYLAAQRFVHRDLAARNCMVDKYMTTKVADFGLSRDLYDSDYYRMDRTSTTPLPVRWMALESLSEQIYTTRTDVWSYGVLLWELLTRGLTPYTTLTSSDAILFVTNGGRLKRPKGCPPIVYRMMAKCWEANPAKRNVFPDIVKELNAVLKQ